MQTIDLFTRDDLESLLNETPVICASIYMPTQRAGSETQQNPIRLKNLLSRVEDQLVARGMRWQGINEILDPGRRILADELFWQYQADGLALFLSPGRSRSWRTPIRFEEQATVSERFDITPLLPLLMSDGMFYILGLSENGVRLLQGTRYTVSEISLEGLPTTIAEALKYDDVEKQSQFRTVGVAMGGAAFHGHRPDAATDKENLLRFFQQIDRGLKPLFSKRQAPVVLAGVEYYFPIYKEANTSAQLVNGGVAGNPDEVTPDELHRRAWQVVAPHFAKAVATAREEYNALVGTGRTANGIRNVLPAARQGRVKSLFVAPSKSTWGGFNEATQTVVVHDEQLPGDVDLLSEAAAAVIRSDGQVFGVDDVPGGGDVAAVLRYAA